MVALGRRIPRIPKHPYRSVVCPAEALRHAYHHDGGLLFRSGVQSAGSLREARLVGQLGHARDAGHEPLVRSPSPELE